MKNPFSFLRPFVLLTACIAVCSICLLGAGCKSNEDEAASTPNANPQQSMQAQIDKIKNDPKIPEASKAAAIAGMQRAQGAAAAASKQGNADAAARKAAGH